MKSTIDLVTDFIFTSTTKNHSVLEWLMQELSKCKTLIPLLHNLFIPPFIHSFNFCWLACYPFLIIYIIQGNIGNQGPIGEPGQIGQRGLPGLKAMHPSNDGSCILCGWTILILYFRVK